MTSRFYWYGSGSHTLQTLDVGPAELQVIDERDADGASPYGGIAVRVDHGCRLRVTIRFEKTPLTDLVKLRSLLSAVQSGLPVGFARDSDKAVLRWIPGASPAPGSTSLLTTGGETSHWEPSAAIASGDVLRLSSPNPEGRSELLLATSLGLTGLLAVSTPTVHRYASPVLCVRPFGFHPILIADPGDANDQTWQSDRELYYDVTMNLIEQPAHLFALRGLFLPGASSSATGIPIARNLAQAIGAEAVGAATAPTIRPRALR